MNTLERSKSRKKRTNKSPIFTSVSRNCTELSSLPFPVTNVGKNKLKRCNWNEKPLKEKYHILDFFFLGFNLCWFCTSHLCFTFQGQKHPKFVSKYSGSPTQKHAWLNVTSHYPNLYLLWTCSTFDFIVNPENKFYVGWELIRTTSTQLTGLLIFHLFWWKVNVLVHSMVFLLCVCFFLFSFMFLLHIQKPEDTRHNKETPQRKS